MVISLKVDKRRSTAQPKWCWSGMSKIPSLHELRKDVRVIVERMPVKASRVELIVSEVLDLGARYHRHLRQVELGPSRAERLAALRQLLVQIDNLLRALGRLPPSLKDELSSALARDTPLRVTKSRAEQYFNNKAAAWRLLAAIDIIQHPRDHGSEVQLIELIHREATETCRLLSSIDTATEENLFFNGELVLRRNWKERLPEVAEVRHRLTRLGRNAIRAIDYLEEKKGAEPASSLAILVVELCELFRRETGSRITGASLGYAARDGKIKPPSKEGQIIVDLAEILQPLMQSADFGALPARAQMLLPSNSGHDQRLRIMRHAKLRDITHRPKETKRGRPRTQ
jgi:hypothetical protein